jgi:hypothetical protein
MIFVCNFLLAFISLLSFSSASGHSRLIAFILPPFCSQSLLPLLLTPSFLDFFCCESLFSFWSCFQLARPFVFLAFQSVCAAMRVVIG